MGFLVYEKEKITSQTSDYLKTISLDEISITLVSSVRHLGFTVTTDLTFDTLIAAVLPSLINTIQVFSICPHTHTHYYQSLV